MTHTRTQPTCTVSDCNAPHRTTMPAGWDGASTLPDTDVFADMVDDAADVMAGLAAMRATGRRASLSGGSRTALSSSLPTTPGPREPRATAAGGTLPADVATRGGPVATSVEGAEGQGRMRRRSSSLSGPPGRQGSPGTKAGGAGKEDAKGQRDFECMCDSKSHAQDAWVACTLQEAPLATFPVLHATHASCMQF